MANFNQDNRSGGRRSFGGRSSDRASMHQAICSSCGKECEVPFKPTGSRPIFCSKCFENNGGPSSRRDEERTSGRPNFREREMFDGVCDQCGKRCKLPFRPTSGKPIYCSHCFEDKDTGKSPHAQPCHCQDNLEALNVKIDKILKLLTPDVLPKVAQVEDIVNKSLDYQPTEPGSPKKKTRVSKKVASV